MKKLTILIPTHNRLNLLKKAIQSCIKQSCSEFNLMIIDNCSIDGTVEYLVALNKTYPHIQMIFNQSNIGPFESGQKALNIIQTEWVTILCDDDYLDKDFIHYSINILKSTQKHIVSVGYAVVNEIDIVQKRFVYDGKILDINESMLKFLNGDINLAGISGFFFKVNTNNGHKFQELYNYPKGFLTDTMLIVEKILQGDGIELIDKILYYKLEWSNNESAYSIENMLLYFQALLQFGNDMKKNIKNYSSKLSYKSKSAMLSSMPLPQFIRIIIMPIFFKGIVQRKDLNRFEQIANEYNKEYMKHYYILRIASLILTKHTFRFRKSLYLTLLKIRNVKNSFS